MPEKCCGLIHPWDTFRIHELWWPNSPKCLIIGESPGNPDSFYFYDQDHFVRVRHNLLNNLCEKGLLYAPTLNAFKASGFLFDHAIRCQISPAEIKNEWKLAKRYESRRAKAAIHLSTLIRQFPQTWIMGYIARNAVAEIDSLFPRQKVGLKVPYTVLGSYRYFISRYFLNTGNEDLSNITGAFKAFLKS